VAGTDADAMSGTLALAGIDRGGSAPDFFVVVCMVTFLLGTNRFDAGLPGLAKSYFRVD